MNDHETGLLNFVLKNRRERFIKEITNPRLRAGLRSKLCHNNNVIDESYATQIPKSVHTAEQIYQHLKQLGAPGRCFVICRGDIDGEEVLLKEVLDAMLWRMEGIISCIPGKLAYYEGEDARYVLTYSGKE